MFLLMAAPSAQRAMCLLLQIPPATLYRNASGALGSAAFKAAGSADGVATLDSNGKVDYTQACKDLVGVNSNITLAPTHAGKLLYISISGDITITIPDSTEIEIDAEFWFAKGSASTATLSPASGVTVNCAASSPYTITDMYKLVFLKKTSPINWLLVFF